MVGGVRLGWAHNEALAAARGEWVLYIRRGRAAHCSDGRATDREDSGRRTFARPSSASPTTRTTAYRRMQALPQRPACALNWQHARDGFVPAIARLTKAERGG